MADYLLDTTEIIDYVRGIEQTVSLLRTLSDQGAQLGCCEVVVAEVFAGVREGDRVIVNELVEALRFYPVDQVIARSAGEYISQYGRKGITLSLADALIAAVAIAYDLVLVTKNWRHYPMPELRLYPAADAPPAGSP